MAILAWLLLSADLQIVVGQPGMYRIGEADLRAAGWQGPLLWQEMRLSHQGQELPFHVDQPDGPTLTSRSSLLFRAMPLLNELGFRHEYALEDVFLLSRQGGASLARNAPTSPTPVQGTPLLRSRFERDDLLMRFGGDTSRHEIWYWAKLSCNDAQPFAFTFDLADTSLQDGQASFSLSLAVRGWSQIPEALKRKGWQAHELHPTLNGQSLEPITWNDNAPQLLVCEKLPLHLLRHKGNELTLRVPARKDEAGALVVDVTILNWIQLETPLAAAQAQGPALLKEAPAHAFPSRATPIWLMDEGGYFAFLPAHGAPVSFSFSGEVFLTAELQTPTQIRRLEPGAFAPSQADSILICPPLLLEGTQVLARQQERRGIRTRLFTTTAIYDHFNGGIVDPEAIRRLLLMAWQSWPKPAPGYVLLVGDASWDPFHQATDAAQYADNVQPNQKGQLGQIPATPYGEAANRNLIPTFHFFDHTGHSAADNRYACLSGEDAIPELAIGRLPIANAQELQIIVAKQEAYLAALQQEPKKHSILWITNEYPHFQAHCDRFASRFAGEGFSALRVYPAAEEKDNEHNRAALIAALDQGPSLVSFTGHGGRFIWRTGPPDPIKNHDLFRLQDIDALQERALLPVILSFTCFSAPFDHPSADSIGERFVRSAGRGAIAFVGASWRNNPGYVLQEKMLESFTNQQQTIGQAFLAAKRNLTHEVWLETYNLLGDPTLPLQHSLKPLECRLDKGQLSWNLKKRAKELTLNWLNEKGDLLSSTTALPGQNSLALTAPAIAPSHVEILLLDEEKVWHRASLPWPAARDQEPKGIDQTPGVSGQ
jgi:hypothetical protein